MYITNIQPFSLDDGPGIRTTLFLAGCNMRCQWCHNPENLKKIMIRNEQDDNGSKFEIQNSMDIPSEEILEIVLKDKKYYNKSGGGITVSGGEPLCQVDELGHFLKISKAQGINTTVETALNYSYSILENLFPYIDLVIADCKAITEGVHIKCTGVSNEKILTNIEKMSEDNRKFWIRIPVVPNVNITFNEMELIGEFLADKNAELIELIPYHKMGINKYKIWGINYTLNDVKVPESKYMKICYDILSKSCKNVIFQGEG